MSGADGQPVAGPGPAPAPMWLTVAGDEPEGASGSVVALPPADLGRLGLDPGRVVLVHGRRTTAARLLRTSVRDPHQGQARLSAVALRNAAVHPGDRVGLTPAAAPDAVSLRVLAPAPGDPRTLADALAGEPVMVGDRFPWPTAGRAAVVTVRATDPAGPVIVQPGTAIEIAVDEAPRVGFADVGGLAPAVARLREVVELPLLRPELFARLGIEPPRGVLLHGPPGSGKTLLARAVAGEVRAHFVLVSGPEVVHKYYGESEQHLRDVFAEAAARAPAVVFFDEIDALAPARDAVDGQVERRVVAQLMALMDGLEPRGRVFVLAATNIPDALDPALRRPGRFEIELALAAPDAAGRREILEIHTRAMPLGPDVDLTSVAERTRGFVGADLAALCREAGLAALRRATGAEGADPGTICVEARDVDAALGVVRPAGTRRRAPAIAPARWDDVGGLASARARLAEAVDWRLQHGALLRHYAVALPRGILLAGPPGCGKTLLARAVAHECGLPVFAASGAQLSSKWVGETERAIRDLFQRARQAAPALVLIDDVDAIAARGGAGRDARSGDRAVLALLGEMDGLAGAAPVLVLATTSRPDLLDPALFAPGRLEEVIRIGPLSRGETLAVLRVHTRALPLDSAVDLEVIADLTAGRRGAELAALCQDAARLALRQALATGGVPGVVTAGHFWSAIESRPAAGASATTAREAAESALADRGSEGAPG